MDALPAAGETTPARPVSRAGRALDALALLLVLGGGAAYLVSYLGLERIRREGPSPFRAGMPISQLAEYHRFEAISHWGLAGILAGVSCAVGAWFLERRRQAAPSTLPP